MKLKRKIIKKIAIVSLWVLGIFIALDLLLVSLFFIPPIQQAVVNKVTTMLSSNWGSDINIEKIYVTPTLKIAFEGLTINDNRQNAMITVAQAKARLKKIGFAPFTLSFFTLEVDGADVILEKYIGDESVNIGLWARKIKKNDEKGTFTLHADHLLLENSRFSYTNEATNKYDGTNTEMDYAFFELQDITFNFNDFNVRGADISGQIVKLAFEQYTGFTMLEASANFRINENGMIFDKGKMITANSKIFLDLKFDYDNWSSYSSFTDSIRINATLRPSWLSMKDVAAFAPSLKGMEQNFVFEGEVEGVINDMDIRQFALHYQKNTVLAGNLHAVNITNFKNAQLNLDLQNSTVNPKELSGFALPKSKTLTIPEKLHAFGNARLKGHFKGSPKNFKTDLALSSDLGNAAVELAAAEDRSHNLQYSGCATTQSFNLGQLIQNQKLLGMVDLNAELSGAIKSKGKDNSSSIELNVDADIARFDLLGYPINHIAVQGTLADKQFDGTVTSDDKNLNFDFDGTLDFSGPMINTRSALALHRFAPGAIVASRSPIDSTTAQGIDKFLLYAQRNPTLELSFNSLELNMRGDELAKSNGFVSVDNIKLQNDGQTIQGERIRLTKISMESGLQKIILVSNFLNADISTTYPLTVLKDSLLEVAYHYFPNILPQKEEVAEPIITTLSSDKEYYFQLSLETFQTRDIFSFLLPEIRIAPRTTCDLYVSSHRHNDRIDISTQSFRFNEKLRVSNFTAHGKNIQDAFRFSMTSDSIILPQKKNNITFKTIALNTDIKDNNTIHFDLQWMNPAAISDYQSSLAGTIDASKKDDITVVFTNSTLNLQGNVWSFNDDHLIRFQRKQINFDNVVLRAGESNLNINGLFSFLKEDNLSIDIKNVDLKQINAIMSNMNLSFAGDLSARIRIHSWNQRRLITGKVMAGDFAFNDEMLGNLFLVAALPEASSIGFGGGLFHRDNPINSVMVDQYTMRDFNNEPLKLANLSGRFESAIKNLTVNATMDTLRIGFLSPFLQSFSHIIEGSARGELTFKTSPDSTYFEGKVIAQKATLGIAPLNTVYTLDNQTIEFNQKGIIFNSLTLKDMQGNSAVLTGYVHHQKFKDFKIDLSLETNRIMALNAPKKSDTYFYGDGFVSGRVSIKGDTEKLTFSGRNLRTLSGTKLFLPLTFAERVSESDGIRLKIHPDILQTTAETTPKSSMEMEFDFVFDITKDAEIQIDLDPSIGGVLTARVEGPLQLTYKSTDALNLMGLVNIVGGRFAMAFQDLINIRLDLVPGGTISFNGPIESSVLNAKTLHRTNSSIQELLPDASARRVPVNAYLNLTGNLMTPTIGFNFELPNNSEEDNARLLSAIDLSNMNNGARHFFSLWLTSKFAAASEMENQNSNMGNTIGNTGAEMLSGMLSNLLFQQIKYGEFGFNYKASDSEHAAEYSMNATIPVFNDRIIIQGNVGYADGSGTSSGVESYIMGDASIEFLLNEEGSWRFKAFYTNTDESSSFFGNSQGQVNIGGVALIYRKEFNDGKDFLESFRKKPGKNGEQK